MFKNLLFQDSMCDDLLHELRKYNPNAKPEDVYDKGLHLIDQQLAFYGKSLAKIPDMPTPDVNKVGRIARELEEERFRILCILVYHSIIFICLYIQGIPVQSRRGQQFHQHFDHCSARNIRWYRETRKWAEGRSLFRWRTRRYGQNIYPEHRARCRSQFR